VPVAGERHAPVRGIEGDVERFDDEVPLLAEPVGAEAVEIDVGGEEVVDEAPFEVPVFGEEGVEARFPGEDPVVDGAGAMPGAAEGGLVNPEVVGLGGGSRCR